MASTSHFDESDYFIETTITHIRKFKEDDLIKRFEVIELKAYLALDLLEYEIEWKDMIIYAKGLFLNSASPTRIVLKYPDYGFESIKYDLGELKKKDKPILLPKRAQHLADYYKNIINNPKENLNRPYVGSPLAITILLL